MHSDRVRKILSWYDGQPPGVLANLARMMNAGRLAGTGNVGAMTNSPDTGRGGRSSAT